MASEPYSFGDRLQSAEYLAALQAYYHEIGSELLADEIGESEADNGNE